MCQCWCGVSGWCVPCCSGGASCTNTTQVLCWAHGTVQPLSTLYLHYLLCIYTIYSVSTLSTLYLLYLLYLHITLHIYVAVSSVCAHHAAAGAGRVLEGVAGAGVRYSAPAQGPRPSAVFPCPPPDPARTIAANIALRFRCNASCGEYTIDT